jgi:hypothetical protein
VGITAFSRAGVWTKRFKSPDDLNWRHVASVSVLGGIGFAMSIFIALLAYRDPVLVQQSKIAIMISSSVAGVLGYRVIGKVLKGSVIQQHSKAPTFVRDDATLPWKRKCELGFHQRRENCVDMSEVNLEHAMVWASRLENRSRIGCGLVGEDDGCRTYEIQRSGTRGRALWRESGSEDSRWMCRLVQPLWIPQGIQQQIPEPRERERWHSAVGKMPVLCWLHLRISDMIGLAGLADGLRGESTEA